MAREYRTGTTGPASPSPMSLGSADLNLQTPTFRAQTSVDMGVNVFEQIQNILGLGVQAAQGMVNLQTQQIQNEMSYERAVEDLQEQEIRRVERAEMRAEREENKLLREQAKKEKEKQDALDLAIETAEARGDSAAVAKLREDAIKAKIAPSVSRGTTALRSLEAEANRKEAEKDRLVFDGIKSEEATYSRQILDFENDGNSTQLNALYAEFKRKAEADPDANRQQMFTGLMKSVDSARDRLMTDAERKADEAERQSLGELDNLLQMEISPHIDGLRADPVLGQQIAGRDAEATRKATYEYIQGKLAENPVLKTVMDGKNDKEKRLVRNAIYRNIDSFVNQQIEQQANQARLQADATERNSMMEMSRDPEGFQTALESISAKEMDGLWSPYKSADMRRRVSKSYLEAAPSNVDGLKRSRELMQSDDPAAVQAAATHAAKLNSQIMSSIGTIRQGIIDSQQVMGPADNPTARGWLVRYSSKDELIRWVVEEKLGTSYEEFLKNEEILGPSLSIVNSVGYQFDRDLAESMRIDATIRRSAMAAQGKIEDKDVDDVFEASPFGQILKGGDFTPLKDPDALQLEVQNAQYGKADRLPPKLLLATVKANAGNPEAYPLIREFWRFHRPGGNGSLQVALASDRELMHSWALGQFLEYAETTGQYSGEALQGTAQQFMENLKNYSDPAKRSKMGQQQIADRDNAIKDLAQGLSFQSNFWGEDIEIPLNRTFEALEASDQFVIEGYAQIAASLPNTADRQAIMAKMMMSDGYQLMSFDNGNRVDLVYNIYASPTGMRRVLPDNMVMQSDDWNAYVESKKPEIREYLSALPIAEGVDTPFKDPSRGFAIEIVPLASDLQFGRCGIRVRTDGGQVFNVAASSVSVSNDEFLAWSKTNAGRAEKPALTKTQQESASAKNWFNRTLNEQRMRQGTQPQ